MNLSDLFGGLVDDSSTLDKAIDIKGIAIDSRKIKKGFVFLAVAGVIEHGLVYLEQALKNGATVLVYELQGSEKFALDQLNVYQLAITGLGSKLGMIASRYYGYPSSALEVIGITGTNGKTTCSQFLLQMLPECGVIGTLGWGGINDLKRTINTTPDALDIQQMLAEFVELKKQSVVMEVSSHGLQQGRVNEIDFKGAVFTNLSRDHLDYHGSMEAYMQAKLLLFKQPELQYVVVNSNDVNSEKFLVSVHEKVKKWAFSVSGNINRALDNMMVEYVIAKRVDFSLDGISFFISWRNEAVKVQTKIVGDFNLENILAVMTVLLAQGYPLNDIATKVKKLMPVSGRMERFGGSGKPYIFVDYAHTPDALEKVLLGIRKYCQHKLWVVFGCGGNRDQGKRSQMGEIAGQIADQVLITNDNPRFESADQIINDILSGCSNKYVEVIKDREKAIRRVINSADNNDCIVIAGKGHEDYQDINGIKQLFSDQDVVKQALLERDGER